MRVLGLNRTIMFLGAVALLLRSAFPPLYYITDSGNRVPPSSIPGNAPAAGPDVGLLVVHLVTIAVATLFLSYALRRAPAPQSLLHDTPMVEESLRGTSA